MMLPLPALHRPLVAVLVLIATRALIWAQWSAFWDHPDAQDRASQFALLVIVDIGLLAFTVLLILQFAKEQRGSGTSLLLLALALATTVASLTRIVDHTARYASRPTAAPPIATQLMVIEAKAYLTGVLDFDSFNALEATLKRHPDLSTLILDSKGGRISAARGMARIVMEAGLDTHIEASCASACALVFLAGTERSLGPNGQIGFHGYRLNSAVRTLDTGEEQARDASFMKARGVSETFATRAFATPHETMWFPDRETLTQAGVLTIPP